MYTSNRLDYSNKHTKLIQTWLNSVTKYVKGAHFTLCRVHPDGSQIERHLGSEFET
jgi:hypothetical protein